MKLAHVLAPRRMEWWVGTPLAQWLPSARPAEHEVAALSTAQWETQEGDRAGLTRRSFGLLAPGIIGFGVMSGASAAEDRFFDSAGVRIHYIEQGAGEPVVLIHGYTVDLKEQWITTGVFPALAASLSSDCARRAGARALGQAARALRLWA